MDVETVLKIIRTGARNLKAHIQQIRNRYEAELAVTGDSKKAKLAVDPLKKRLPGVAWSGTFAHRANDALLQHSGLICADLDSLGAKQPEVRAKLVDSPHVLTVFVSPTADGIKAVFKVPADVPKHASSFRAVQQHVRELCGVEIDEACKDLARLCFLSYDPDIYVNDNAVEIKLLPPEQPKPSTSAPREKPDKAQIREMLAIIPKRPDYADWIKIVAAVGDVLPDDEAIEVLIEWSPEERGGEYAEKLRQRLKDVHVGTLIHVAREHGWTRKIAPAATAADEKTFAHLASLSPANYDRCRKTEARRLGLRPATLDVEVSARRTPHERGAQGSEVELPNVEPWETPVAGKDVLNEVAATFSRYLVLPLGAADALALWTAHTHAFDAFTHTPRLNFRSPEKGCGKTTALDVTASLTPRALRAENITAPVLFRLVDSCKPTLLLDEVDNYLRNAEELCGLLNAGHKLGAKAFRCEGENHIVRGFAAFAPAALAGIGALPGTLHDRSIVVRLVRAKAGEITARFDSRRIERETELCRKLARLAADNFERLKDCDPRLPETAFNRLADNWRPLFAIAEIVGGDWPRRAKEAFTKLTNTEDLDAQGVGTILLADIAATFAAKDSDKIFSEQLCKDLAEIEGRPWAEWGRQHKPISPNQLATQLRRFSVKPHEVRIGKETGRGYALVDFDDAFPRYLPEIPISDRNTETLQGKTAISEVKHAETVFHSENGPQQRDCFSVSPQRGGISQNANSGERDVEATAADVDAFLPGCDDREGDL
jgi:putative DNA primase/helicase